jgi:penicillin-binding protein 1A
LATPLDHPATWDWTGGWSSPSASRGARARTFRRVAAVVAAVPLLLLGAGAVGFAYVYGTIDLPPVPPLRQTTYLVDRSGRPITELHAAVNRTIIPFKRMPLHLRQAVVAVEDKRFYSHDGVDPFAIARATWADLEDGSFDQGGSTITQQYVKTVFTGSEPSLGRKIREGVMAIKLEHELTKDQILAKYLNTIYFGHGAYGVQAAARTYFGRDAEDLTLLQSATLAGTIALPSRYDPLVDRAAAKVRRNYVLRQMVQVGAISEARATRLWDEPIRTVAPAILRSPAAYFADYTRRFLESRYGPGRVFGGGLRVRTTLDLAWQRAAQRAVRMYLGRRNDPAAAVVAIDPRDGAIRAMVGGRNFRVAKFNLATQAHRQAGSAFKVFTLATALEDGISPWSMWDGPPSISIPNRRCYTNGAPWHVANYADEGAGTMTLAQATAQSVNTIFAQVVTQVGPENVAQMAHRMGIQSPLEPYCSITLGTEEVTPLEMTEAYATLAAQGVRHEPTPVAVVRGPDGNVIDRPIDPAGQAALWPNHANMITSILQDAITSGTGSAAAIGRPAAGKTGTAQDYTNAWFCGYVPQLAACVWVGYPRGNISMRDVGGFPAVYGGSIPALIWHRFMSVATDGMPVQPFQPPSLVEFPTPTQSPTPSPSLTPTPSESPSPTPSDSQSPSPSESASPSADQTATPTPTPSASPSSSTTPQPP